jgi:hypothetical protein
MYLQIQNAYLSENFSMPLNIYNEPLEKCPDHAYETNGSWMSDKTCSEIAGGVHQICYKSIGTNSNQFSKNTGQSDWSSTRGNQNHCVCLGAWSLYKKKIDDKSINSDNSSLRLKCNAIPKTVFDPKYINSFSTWNNQEQKLQIINGVEGIIKECIQASNNNVEKKALIDNYCKLSKEVKALQNRPMFQSNC